MSPATVGIIGIGVMVLLFFSRMPIGFVMLLVGFLGFSYLRSVEKAIGMLGMAVYGSLSVYDLAVIPLFLLMGQFAFYGGLSRDFYFTMYKWLGRLPGGLAIATIGGCAGFAAVCGSSVATAVTMGSVALPEMQKYKYDSKLAVGSIAAGGTLGILIPPSIAFVVYGIITSTPIGPLLLSGFLPGLLLAGLFMLLIYIMARRNPAMGPPGPVVSLREKVTSLKGCWGILSLFILVIGGIYSGVFTPTEGAAFGAFAALLISLGRRSISWQHFLDTLLSTGKTSAMIFAILIGASVFSYFIAVTKIPSLLADIIAGLAVHRLVILSLILFMYVILGCLMEAFSMVILTMPIIFPIIQTLGFDPIWFGVLMVIMIEMGMITPPVGLNVFVMQGVARDVPLYTIFRGAAPFVLAMVVCIIILIIFPSIALFLPGIMTR